MYAELWKKCVQFHGHSCPGLATGFRAAVEGTKALGIPLERARDEEIVCVSENDTCAVDAIQCMLSCTVGKGNLTIRPRGKAAFSFFDRRTGKAVRVVIIRQDPSMSREEATERIRDGPSEGLIELKEPGFDVPEKARIFENKVCEICGESSREDLVRFQEGRIVCLDCFNSYDRGWM